MNSGIKNYLNEYVKQPDPQFAVLIKGDWGCGKTYFIKNWIEKQSPEVLTPIYVSLYGLKHTKQITTAINRVLYPILYGKLATISKSIGKVLSGIVFKHEVDLDGDEDKDIFINLGFDSLSILSSNDENIKSDKFLIFDDFERCQVELQELLGYINYLVEHCHCHVLIIGDISQIRDSHSRFNAFKEKTIGREFILKPEYDDAIKSFVNEPQIGDFVKEHIENIKKTFEITQSKNLRVLRQCLYDFSRQQEQVDQPNDERYKDVMLSVLCSFITTYCEYKGKNGNDLSKWRKIINNTFKINEDNNEKERIMSVVNSIQSKYKTYSSSFALGVFRTDIVNEIISYIENGYFITNYINELIMPRTVSLKPSWERFQSAELLQNNEFVSLYKEVLKDLVEQNIRSMYDLGTVIGRLSYFEKKGINLIDSENKSLIKESLPKYLDKFTSVEECFKAHTLFTQGLQYTILNSEHLNDNEFISEFENIYKTKMSELKTPITILLENLNDVNSHELNNIGELLLPDKSTTYEQIPIFNQVDIEKLFDNLKKLNNEGRNKFNNYIQNRYLLKYKMNTWDRNYSDELEALFKLKEMIDNEISHRKLIDKLSLENISDSIGSAIKRIEGDFF